MDKTMLLLLSFTLFREDYGGMWSKLWNLFKKFDEKALYLIVGALRLDYLSVSKRTVKR